LRDGRFASSSIVTAIAKEPKLSPDLREQADGESKNDESDSPDRLDTHVIQSMLDAVEMKLL
jgi:hypothetical protein